MALACAAPVAAHPVPITIGETHTLASKPLAQERAAAGTPIPAALAGTDGPP